MGRLHKLNSTKVNTPKEPGLYSDGGCLHLRVAPGGSKQWVFRYSLGHRTRDYGVGPFPTLSLAEARDRAHAIPRRNTPGEVATTTTNGPDPWWPTSALCSASYQCLPWTLILCYECSNRSG